MHIYPVQIVKYTYWYIYPVQTVKYTLKYNIGTYDFQLGCLQDTSIQPKACQFENVKLDGQGTFYVQ